VLAEVAGLAARGVREVNLLGQNVNAYQGVMEDGTFADLALLIHYVAAIEGIDRIRFTTSHPVEFSDNLINVYAEVPELVSMVHLPVQSGSDRILAAMKRGHTADEYREKIKRLRAVRPNISISSDFIIGFPGESDEDFNATMQLVADIGFDQSYSFIYSARPGTPAADMLDDTTLLIKKHRLAILQDVLANNASAISKSMIGSVQRILVEGSSRKTVEHKTEPQMSGRSENGRVVNFDGDDTLTGKFVDVRIVDAWTNSLQGEVVAVVDDCIASTYTSETTREARTA
jgi:tRNA-2-methylthio-N6-dimethylallyladenosine synthase